MKNDPLEKLKDIPTLMDEWMCQSRAMSSSEQRAWLISALENCVALGITKGREEMREEWFSAFAEWVPLGQEDYDPKVCAKNVIDLWGEKSKDEALSSLNNLTDK